MKNRSVSRLFREISKSFFLEHIPPGARVLDCGCGEGDVSIALAEHGCIVDALDRNPERILVLESRRGDLEVRTHLCDIQTAPFDNDTFDYVISRQFMPHFDNWPEILSKQIALCRIGGAVIFHHHSGDNFSLCESIAPTARHRAAVRRGYPRNGHASREELKRLCRRLGTELESLTPITFFLPSALLYRTGLDKAEREQYGEELEKRMQHPEVYDFVRWYERHIISRLPVALSCSFMAIVRRSSATSSIAISEGNLVTALIRRFGGRNR